MPCMKTIYTCKYCDKEFMNETECAEHEDSHIKKYDDASNEEIAKELESLSDSAYGWHMNDMVIGIPVSNFENLLDVAAKRLRKDV